MASDCVCGFITAILLGGSTTLDMLLGGGSMCIDKRRLFSGPADVPGSASEAARDTNGGGAAAENKSTKYYCDVF